MRIAMWSGPRNISTAMMRSFGNRPDTVVCDEPLYAYYLATTGLPHPGAAEVIASQENDWRKVAAWLAGPIPGGKRVWYQKHMTHHLLPEIELDQLAGLSHCFLLRDPAEMLVSLSEFIPSPTLADTGLPQQADLFRRVRDQTGRTPPVVDASDVLRNPRAMLSALCAALDLPFDEAMLAWPPGPRATDGVWAKHWYAKVEQTTGFQPYQPRQTIVLPSLAPHLACCQPIYEELHEHRLTNDK